MNVIHSIADSTARGVTGVLGLDALSPPSPTPIDIILKIIVVAATSGKTIVDLFKYIFKRKKK
jgi:hypothetical protein